MVEDIFNRSHDGNLFEMKQSRLTVELAHQSRSR
jgi:hypothetical protein